MAFGADPQIRLKRIAFSSAPWTPSGIASNLRKEVEDTSASIDRMQLEVWVDYDPKYDIGDNLEDAMEKYFNGDAGQ